MAILVDTSVLGRLANRADVSHPVAKAAVAELHRRGEVLQLTPQNLVEFRNFATRPVSANGLGLAAPAAEALAATFELVRKCCRMNAPEEGRAAMYRTILLVCLGGLVLGPLASAQQPKRSVIDLIADLKKGEKEQLKAIQELEAWGEKAADAVPALVDLLATKNEDVRLNATLALGKIGSAAVGPLSKAAAAKDEDVRFYAVWGLAFVGPPAKSATPVLVQALADPSPPVRRKAAFALGRINPDAEAVVGPLVAALGDKDADVSQAAGTALATLGKAAVPALMTAMKSDQAAVRAAAVKTIGDIGPAAEAAVPELIQLLLNPDKFPAADRATTALAGIGAPAVPALTTAADHDNPIVRALAMQTLQRIGVPAVPALVDLLGSKHVDVRRLAAAHLGSVPVNDKMVVIGLGYATKDKDFQVRKNALQALRSRGAGAKLAEPYISVLLTDLDPQIRLDAFHALQGLGVDPRAGLKKALSHSDPAIRINTASLMTQLNLEVDLAEPILLEGLKDKDAALKMQAAYALSLRGLQADVVLPIFMDGLKSDVASVRRQAAEAIVRYGPKARKAAPALIAALDDADDSVRARALLSLREVGEEPKVLLPAMVKLLRRKDDPLHPVAAQVVFQIGPELVGDLVALLKTEDAPAVRLTCLQTLAMIGPPAKDAVGELLKALEDPTPRARLTAARALGNIGPDAKAALPALVKAEKDPDANVQKVAQTASAQIRADAKQKEFQVQGVLTAGDPLDRVRAGCYHVVHIYPMKAGQSYTIDLISSWDNFLRLENAQGKQLAFDDDSGGNLNARITFAAPEDGWYRIIVTSYGQGVSGSYTLKVR